MGPRAAFTMACIAGTLVVACAAVSCGARTGLEGETSEPGDSFDGGSDQFIADEVSLPDQFVPFDAFPRVDVATPDAPVFNACPDASATLIYAVGQSGTLYSYDPAATTKTFTTIGVLSCPRAGGTTPFSMAVDREGVAYVAFFDESASGVMQADNLYRVSTKTAACTRTAYNPASNGRVTYGMSFVANASDGGETLFIAEQPVMPDGTPEDDILATVDTTTFTIRTIGAFAPPAALSELAGTGDGRLFAFYNPGAVVGVDQSSVIAQVDPVTANVTPLATLNIATGEGWAFGYWGGDFFLFTAPDNGQNTHTVVVRYDPVDRSVVEESAVNDIIVGAGVSTCAPSQ